MLHENVTAKIKKQQETDTTWKCELKISPKDTRKLKDRLWEKWNEGKKVTTYI